METNCIAKKKREWDFDPEQLNKCTLCDYRTHVKSTFHRHLMKRHGIKLKALGAYAESGPKTANNDGLNKTGPQQFHKRFGKSTPRNCPNCNKRCRTKKYYTSHILQCSTGNMYKCPKCNIGFEKKNKLNRHLLICGLGLNVNCQLCPLKFLSVSRVSRHYMNTHNLICRGVEEPDFDQVLTGTPYILERALELEALPTFTEVTAAPKDDTITQIRLEGTTASKKKLFSCDICKKEFIKQRFLNRHMFQGCD